MRLALLGFATVLMVAPASAARYSSHPGGSAPIYAADEVPHWIHFGDTYLIDNHRCPAGQLMELTGGNSGRGVPNQRRCVPHP